MTKLDPSEKEIPAAYENGDLKFAAPAKRELAGFKSSAAATFIQEERMGTRRRSEKLTA